LDHPIQKVEGNELIQIIL